MSDRSDYLQMLAYRKRFSIAQLIKSSLSLVLDSVRADNIKNKACEYLSKLALECVTSVHSDLDSALVFAQYASEFASSRRELEVILGIVQMANSKFRKVCVCLYVFYLFCKNNVNPNIVFIDGQKAKCLYVGVMRLRLCCCHTSGE